jgi:hypothetical protein
MDCTLTSIIAHTVVGRVSFRIFIKGGGTNATIAERVGGGARTVVPYPSENKPPPLFH